MELAAHINALRAHGTGLADAADRAGLEASVPPCPSWQVRDLLRHIGFVHRWAARHLTERPATVLDGPSEKEILASGAPDEELIDWFRLGHAALVDAFTRADPDLTTATLMATAPTPLGFWARRQAHETAIHRADADAACGVVTDYPADFAVDGIDELVTGFGNRRKYRPPDGAGGLGIQAADTGDAWLVRSADGRSEAGRGLAGRGLAGQPSCLVTGPARDVYLFLWNRGGTVSVTGDERVLAAWKEAVRVRWA